MRSPVFLWVVAAAAAVFVPAILAIAVLPPGGPPAGCARCPQDVAKAVWFAFNMLDCDSNSDPGAVCQEDLADVNRAPGLTRLSVDSKGGVTVGLDVFRVSSMQPWHVTVRLSPGGQVVSARSDAP